MAKLKSEIELTCPCCGAILVSTRTSTASSRTRSRRARTGPDLDYAAQLVDQERARREAIFQQSVEAEKTRGDALSRRFDEALRQARQEPVTKPTRDFDLD